MRPRRTPTRPARTPHANRVGHAAPAADGGCDDGLASRRAGTPLRAAVLVAVLALVAVGCGRSGSPPARGPEPPPATEYAVDRDFTLPGSDTWRHAKRRGHLVVGTKEDQPGMAEKDPATGVYSGFDVEIAKMLAASLGFDPVKDVQFKAIASANRETALQNGQIDYYVGTYTINEGRKRLVSFAGPYYLAGQRLLVRRDESGVTGPQRMAGKKVCSAVGSTPLQNLESGYPRVNAVAYDSYAICVDNLLNNQVDAVTTDDTILLGYASKLPDELKVVGKAFSEEPYGVGVPKADRHLARALADGLAEREKNGDWKRAYDATLGLSGRPAPKPPPIDRTLAG